MPLITKDKKEYQCWICKIIKPISEFIIGKIDICNKCRRELSTIKR